MSLYALHSSFCSRFRLEHIIFVHTVSQLFHLGEGLSNENPVASQEELEDLKREASEERDQRLAREMEILDLKDKVKDLERTAEVSSADAQAAGKRNSELEEAMGTLKHEMVIAINGARVIARWELMREWLKGQSNQWDLAKALEQYKAVTLEEVKHKNAPLPTFEDEAAIPPVSRRPGGSST